MINNVGAKTMALNNKIPKIGLAKPALRQTSGPTMGGVNPTMRPPTLKSKGMNPIQRPVGI